MTRNNLPPEFIPLFPLLFAGMWLFVTTLLGFMSGWFRLMSEFPDTQEKGDVLGAYKGRSGQMGAMVNLNGILTLEAYRYGLRIKILRLFGPFQRPIFIPWEAIKVVRKKTFMRNSAELSFGSGRLRIDADLANLLWQDAGSKWSEAGAATPVPPKSEIGGTLFRQWLVVTASASAFFILAPQILRWMHPEEIKESDFPPIALAIAFPAIVFGIVTLIRYFYRVREFRKKREM